MVQTARPFQALDLLTGVVTRFETLQEAKEAGFCPGTISDVLNGHRKKYGGRKWQYCDESSLNECVQPSQNEYNQPSRNDLAKLRHQLRADTIVAIRSARLSRLTEAIVKLPKPWGPGTATELNSVLADWYGQTGYPVNVPCSLGHHLPRIKEILASQGIEVEIGMDTRQKTSTYRITRIINTLDEVQKATGQAVQIERDHSVFIAL